MPQPLFPSLFYKLLLVLSSERILLKVVHVQSEMLYGEKPVSF